MCRLCIYIGKKPIYMADLITRPQHSILRQSFASKERQNKDPLNGDGFGISWYNDEPVVVTDCPTCNAPPSSPFILDCAHYHGEDSMAELNYRVSSLNSQQESMPSVQGGQRHRILDHIHEVASPLPTPGVFLSVTPAWNNLNLQRLAAKISCPLFFAHVRAATPGTLTSETNCHPFQFHHYTWMHNGNISEFKRIKRRVLDMLSNELYNHLQGTTDSEASFLLFMELLRRKRPEEPLSGIYFSPMELREAMEETIRTLVQLSLEQKIEEPSTMNFCVSDGKTVIATRYINHPTQDPASLYFASGSSFVEVSEGDYAMLHLERRPACHIIASEPLTKQLRDWIPVPRNSLIMVTRHDCNLLIFPIQCEA